MMNQRIKELWVQGTQTGVPREGDYSSVSAKNIEKFTELIIQECADIVLGFHNQFGDSAHNEIREHFGVQE